MADDIKDAGVGHNSGVEHQEEVVWERWTKKRVFVRARARAHFHRATARAGPGLARGAREAAPSAARTMSCTPRSVTMKRAWMRP